MTHHDTIATLRLRYGYVLFLAYILYSLSSYLKYRFNRMTGRGPPRVPPADTPRLIALSVARFPPIALGLQGVRAIRLDAGIAWATVRR